jgi:hypothetical protein
VKALVNPDDPLPVSFGPIWWFWADALESLRGELLEKIEEFKREARFGTQGQEFECDDERLKQLSHDWGRLEKQKKRQVMYWWLESIREQFEVHGDPVQRKDN